MAIITISRGSYSKGKEIAEKVAQLLGYKCVARDVLLETSEEFNVPEIKLIRAIHDAPSFINSSKPRKIVAVNTITTRRVLILGPAVSLKGSPTVSPVIEAL